MFMQTVRIAQLIGRSLLFLLLMLPQWAWAESKLNIFVSVLPQKTFVERIGGDVVNVSAMVKSGFSPATYEPTPRQIAKLAKASAYIRTGVPFEQAWMPRIQSVNPDMLLLDARDGITLLELAAHDHDDAHGHSEDKHDEEQRGGEEDEHDEEAHHDHAEDGTKSEAHRDEEKILDPHLWTNPRIVIKMADQIKAMLLALRPEASAMFITNHAALVAELTALDEELQALFKASKAQRFMVFHPSWGYFAEAYGLEQIAIEAAGKEPGARALTALIKQARQSEVKTIFIQPQFDKRAAKQVAKAIGGNVVAVDPLAEDYFATMRTTARLIAETGVVQTNEQ